MGRANSAMHDHGSAVALRGKAEAAEPFGVKPELSDRLRIGLPLGTYWVRAVQSELPSWRPLLIFSR